MELHPIPIEKLARIVAPPKPPPAKTLYHWLQVFGCTNKIEGKIALSADELAVLTAYGWLRVGTPLKLQQAKTVARKALSLLRGGRATVLIVLRITRSGVYAEVGTAPVPPARGVYVFNLTQHVERVDDCMKRGAIDELVAIQ